MAKIYLHAGLPKTGTTTIQNWLAENAVNLRKVGIFTFPESGLAHRLAVDSITLPKRLAQPDIPLIMSRSLEDARSALEQARDDPEIKVIVLSSEYFSEANPESVKLAFANLSLSDVAVIFILRRQDRLLESGYSQSVKEMAWTDPLRSPHYSPNYDWYRLASSWSAVFGRDNVILRSYEEIVASGEPLIPMAFKDLDSSLSAFAKKHGGTDRVINPSLPAALIEFKRLANIAGASDLLPILEAASERGVGGPRFRLERSVAKKWLDHYRDSNRKLAREYFGRNGELFDETDLEEESPGADYTGKLPVETVAMLLALFMDDARRRHSHLSRGIADLATAKQDLENAKASVHPHLERTEELLNQLAARMDDLHQATIIEDDRRRVMEEQIKKLKAKLIDLNELVSSPRRLGKLYLQKLASFFKRT